jgi:hypothetical protein
VHPNVRRRGVGRRLVKLAVEVARERGVEWVHVDFDGHLREFYYECGFRRSEAGLLHLNKWDEDRNFLGIRHGVVRRTHILGTWMNNPSGQDVTERVGALRGGRAQPSTRARMTKKMKTL